MDEQGFPLRIGDEERRAAVDALTAHREAGRLEPTEYEERQVVASRARTWNEIGPLFADLPQPHPVGMPAALAVSPADAPLPPVAGGPAVPVPPVHVPPPAPPGLIGARLPGRSGETIMALTPFAALLLFWGTGSWIWFLMIPIMGILLFGPEGDRGRKRRR